MCEAFYNYTFNLYTNSSRKVIIMPFYSRENWGSEVANAD